MNINYAGYEATGRTPSQALYRLMNKVGYQEHTNEPNYELAFDTRPIWQETDVNDYYITNVMVRDGRGGYTRAVIQKFHARSQQRRHFIYYKAWFGLPLIEARRQIGHRNGDEPSKYPATVASGVPMNRRV